METMKVITVENQEQAAQQVLDILQEEFQAGKLDVLGLATGSTMVPIYKKWVESDLSCEHVTSFNLDEYVGARFRK